MRRQGDTVLDHKPNWTGVSVVPDNQLYVALPRLYKFTGRSGAFHDVRELRECIESIMKSQGYHADRPNVRSPDLGSFKPLGSFIWLARNDADGKIDPRKGSIDSCHFLPYPGERIFVSSRWGIAVADTIQKFGVVAIHEKNNGHENGCWGHRWNKDVYTFSPSEITWLK